MMAAPSPPGAAIWRDFTRETLDRAYSPSSMVESIEPYLACYALQSLAARQAHDPARIASHAYGPSPEQTLDLFLPPNGPAPLLAFIHGGYWQALSKSDASFPATPLTGAGVAYAAINYTLAPHATMDAIVEENRRALAWLHANGAGLGIAEGGMVIAGHSAGAQLAAMMLTTDWTARGIAPDFIRGAVLIGGVYDLEPIRLSYVNEALGMDARDAARNSPLLTRPPVDRPVAISWAERDTEEFKRQSRELAAAWGAQARDLAIFEQPGVNHFDCLFDWANPRSRLWRETMRLLGL